MAARHDNDAYSVSVRLDGQGIFYLYIHYCAAKAKANCLFYTQLTLTPWLYTIASIEHQIDIHVIDLVDASENPDISVSDILQGLKYVVDYRLAGGKLPHLDQALMKKLAQGLLEITPLKAGNILNQSPTPEADLAFHLLADFLFNIVEFRLAIAEISVSDLRYKLKLHRRCRPRASEEQRVAAATILGLLTTRIGNQFKVYMNRYS